MPGTRGGNRRLYPRTARARHASRTADAGRNERAACPPTAARVSFGLCAPGRCGPAAGPATVRRRPGWRGGLRAATIEYAGQTANRHTARRVYAHAARRGHAPVHLWAALPGIAPRARPAGPAGAPHQNSVGQCAPGARVETDASPSTCGTPLI